MSDVSIQLKHPFNMVLLYIVIKYDKNQIRLILETKWKVEVEKCSN